jgi:hypothetical protein
MNENTNLEVKRSGFLHIHNKKNKLIVVLGIVLICAAGVVAQHYLKQKRAFESERKADTFATKGDYGQSAEQLVTQYKSVTDKNQKAQIAYSIGMSYYYAHNPKLGKTWLQTSIDLYNKLGKTEEAKNVEQSLTRSDSIYNSSNPAAGPKAQERHTQDGQM